MEPRGAGSGEGSGGEYGGRRLLYGSLLLGLLMFLAQACGNVRTGEVEIHGVANFTLPAFPETGGNFIQVFTEMHYQPSFRSQEGPRLLPPGDSVPVTGREIDYSQAEYTELPLPESVQLSYDGARADELFRVNCMVCHGPTLRGLEEQDESLKAKIIPFMSRGPFPADLTSTTTRSATDGELFGFISKGGRQGLAALTRGRESSSPMPEFKRLLTEEERWMLVIYLRSQP